MENMDYSGKPYKIIDSKRERKIGIVATSLPDFITKAQKKLNIKEAIKVVLESDGTEIDEDDYFETLEKNTLIMILKPDEKWCSYSDISIKLADDQIDGTHNLYSLIKRLENDIGQIALLSGCDLELLSDMDSESLADIMALDRTFLDQIKEASVRYLDEKRDIQDTMNLLKLYHEATVGKNLHKKNKV